MPRPNYISRRSHAHLGSRFEGEIINSQQNSDRRVANPTSPPFHLPPLLVPPPRSAAATMSAMDVEPSRERVCSSPRSIMYTHGSTFCSPGARNAAPFKTASGYSLSPKPGNSPPLRISTMAIADQAARFGLDPGHGQNFTRFGLEAHAEATTQPMEDDELDMDLAAPVDEIGAGRDPNVFKSFWNCCNGMRS